MFLNRKSLWLLYEMTFAKIDQQKKKKKRETEIQATIEFLILRESVRNNFAME